VADPYPDFVARFYDVVYAQVRDGVDNEFYLERMSAAGGPVLEIGVGAGRLFAEARRRGLIVSSAPADLSRQTNRVRMRFFFRFEIEHLVARSKLVLEGVHGDFAGGPLAADSREYVVVCRRPGRFAGPRPGAGGCQAPVGHLE
jgi:hypothetical protein